MKSEVIFKYTTSWRGRYTQDEGYEITIYADCDDPTVWPYQVKYRRWEVSEFDDDPEIHEEETKPIPAPVFNKIKELISDHTEILLCNEDLYEGWTSNNVAEDIWFACDAFTKSISGNSLFYDGQQDYQSGKDSDFATIYVLAKQITDILQEQGIDYLKL